MEFLNISSHIDKESGQDSGRGRSTGEKECSSSSSTEELGHSCPEIAGVPRKGGDSSFPECSVDIDLEGGEEKRKSHLMKFERDCRICHLTLDGSNQESGFPIELGCSCKDDLAAAHKQCAEAWFKIKGNRTCEICGSVARNVSGPNETEMSEQWHEENVAVVVASIPGRLGEAPRYFWQGHRFLNFLLACMVFAFVISWLFHFNVPS